MSSERVRIDWPQVTWIPLPQNDVFRIYQSLHAYGPLQPMEERSGRPTHEIYSSFWRAASRVVAFRRRALFVAAKYRSKTTIPPTSDTTTVFRFMDLPPEVRQMILEYTGLVFSSEESEGRGLKSIYFRPHLPVSPLFLSRALCLPWYLETKSPSHPLASVCVRCFDPTLTGLQHRDCGPAALFLVSKQVREEALRVFFHRNRFIFVCDPDDNSVERALQVSGSIPSQRLRLLKTLVIDGIHPPEANPIPPYTRFDQPPPYRAWEELFSFFERKAHPKLTIEIAFSGIWQCRCYETTFVIEELHLFWRFLKMAGRGDVKLWIPDVRGRLGSKNRDLVVYQSPEWADGIALLRQEGWRWQP